MSQNLARTCEHVDLAACTTDLPYAVRYAESIRDPEAFWGRIGKRLTWSHPYSKVKDVSFQ